MERRTIVYEFRENGFTGRVDFDQEVITIGGNGLDVIEIPLTRYAAFADFVLSGKYEIGGTV